MLLGIDSSRPGSPDMGTGRQGEQTERGRQMRRAITFVLFLTVSSVGVGVHVAGARTDSTQGVKLIAVMDGSQEVPPADPDGTGTAQIKLDAKDSEVCWKIKVEDITLPATGAHIHQAPRGENGPIVVPLSPPDASGKSKGCATVEPALLVEIQADPAGFYVNVHTTDYPNGAIRGQLAPKE
jgi:hypothetical protein